MGEAIVSPAVGRLMNRGVIFRSPHSVEIDQSVNPERIAPGVIIHSGCRIAGAETSVGPGSELGKEAPAVIEDCQLGHNVELKGGFFSGATFLNGASMGSAAHVRPGTLIEEEAGGAHAVGFKQTILFPFVTAGSLINFCDVVMAGGTSRKNHSEIGSSYIHFNFTPHQDKATPSLIGDVPHGVFLYKAPIFLGGQGGLVGPARIAYGTVIPAGTICRQDVLEEGKLFNAVPGPRTGASFACGIYRGINRILVNNLTFIGNLWALKAWYRHVRIRTMYSDVFSQACHTGALTQIDEALRERIRRLKELADKMPFSLQHAQDLPPQIKAQQQYLIDRWPEMEAKLQAGWPATAGEQDRDIFIKEWEQGESSSDHVKSIALISPAARQAGTAWLQRIVDSASALWSTK